MKRLLLSVLMLTLVLTACTTTKPQVEPTTDETFKVVQNGSFVIGTDMKIVTDSIPAEKVINWYFDPLCPACVKLETALAETNKDIVKKDFYIQYHPMTFLNNQSTDAYSERTAGYILGVAEFAPEIAYSFLTEVMHPNFYPMNDAITDESKYKDLFTELGGTEEQWEMITKNHLKLVEIANNHSFETFESPEIIAKTPKNNIYVPMLLIGTSEKFISFSGQKSIKDYMLSEIDKYIGITTENTTSSLTSELDMRIVVNGLKDSYSVDEEVTLTVSGLTDDETVVWELDGATQCSLSNKEGTTLKVIETYRDCDLVVKIIKNGEVTETIRHTIKIK